MSAKYYPSIEYVRQRLREENGHLFWLFRPREHFVKQRFWLNWNARYDGKEAGGPQTCGGSKRDLRWTVVIDGLHYRRYRIVWAFHHNEWRLNLDHENRDKMDDRIENIRPSTESQNHGNMKRSVANTSGYKGVWWEKRWRKWEAGIKVNGKKFYLGRFDDPAEAHAAYVEAAKKHFGEFACDGT